MKRYTRGEIELLKRRSKQSRNGEPVEAKKGKRSLQFLNGLKLTIGKVGRARPKNDIVIDLGDDLGPMLQVRITKGPKRRR